MKRRCIANELSAFIYVQMHKGKKLLTIQGEI